MKTANRRISLKQAKRGVITSILLILILTILEMPKPVGFETRPQDNVSLWWLLLFLSILTTEITAMIGIRKSPGIGARLAIVAGSLNIFQIVADLDHMMQPEIASWGSVILEYIVGALSIGLIYFALKVHRAQTGQ